MKTKFKTVFKCSECSQETPRWLGQCPGCGRWNTLEESAAAVKAKGTCAAPAPLTVLSSLIRETPGGLQRHPSGYAQLDEALGGGFMDGSLVLLGGAPGVGKSTLTSHIAGLFASQGKTALIASGEEEPEQIASRLLRLGVAKSDSLYLTSGPTIEALLTRAQELKPKLLVVDSAQTIASETLPYPIGSPGLIRFITGELLAWAKKSKAVVLLLGHVTKDGLLAGPKHMEHMVDVVLQMEKPRSEEHRILRVAKNRFGATNYLVVFEMGHKGLAEIADPSASFISTEWRERLSGEKGRIGLTSAIAIDGGRPFLIQIESLIGKRKMAPGKRTSLGVDRSRMEMLLAVLEKNLGLSLEFSDVFLSILGGLKVKDPGTDLAILMALASSALEFPLSTSAIFAGEVSLAGDVLKPRDLQTRVRQAKSLGYSQIFHARKGMDHVREFIHTLKTGPGNL